MCCSALPAWPPVRGRFWKSTVTCGTLWKGIPPGGPFANLFEDEDEKEYENEAELMGAGTAPALALLKQAGGGVAGELLATGEDFGGRFALAGELGEGLGLGKF